MKSNTTNTNSGVVYVAFGERYISECQQSIRSLRKSSGNINVSVITDRPWKDGPQPDNFIIRDGFGLGSKPRYIYEASPYERTLFIDTDTYVFQDLSKLFDLLNYYDFGARHISCPLEFGDKLEHHPYVASTILLFRRNLAVEELFKIWLDAYENALRSLDSKFCSRLSDDKYLGESIAKSSVRSLHLPEYILIDLSQTSWTHYPPLIFHGRYRKMSSIAGLFNDRWIARNLKRREMGQEPDRLIKVWLPSMLGVINLAARSNFYLTPYILVMRIVNSIKIAFREDN